MAVRFDADGEHYFSTLSVPTPPFTITWWETIDVGRGADDGHISVVANDWNEGWSVFAGDAVGFGNNQFYVFEWPGGKTINGPAGLTLGSYYRYALVVNGASSALYWAQGFGALSSNTGDLSSTASVTTLVIGRAAFSRWHNGRITAVKLWGAALTQAEIDNEHRFYTAGRRANLVHEHPFLAPELTDYSGNGAALSGGTGAAVGDGPPIPWGPARPRLIHIPTIGPPAVEDPPMYLRRVAPARR